MARKLAAGTIRDTAWQLAEYKRLMGKEAAERQERAAKLERGDCVCAHRTFRTSAGYRTVHHRDCVKWKPWMEEHMHRMEKTNERGEAFVRSAGE